MSDAEWLGVSYTSYEPHAYESPQSTGFIQRIAAMHANTLTIVPTRYVANGRSSKIVLDPTNSEPDSSVLKAIADARAAGLKVVLKPHLNAQDGTWQGEFAPGNVSAWFKSYKAMIVGYARMAEATHADMLSIGCEFATLSGAHYRKQWTTIIEAVRSVYHGPITYSASYDEVRHVSFWRQLDYIGVDAYVPVAGTKHPTVASIEKAWRSVPKDDDTRAATKGMSPVDYYHSLSQKYQRPVLFTEVGYRSIDGAAKQPWDWESKGRVDLQEQADCYRALFNVWQQETSWMKGFFLWNWEPTGPHRATDYTALGKPAETIISDAFGRFSSAASAAPAQAAPVHAAGHAAGGSAWLFDSGASAGLIDGEASPSGFFPYPSPYSSETQHVIPHAQDPYGPSAWTGWSQASFFGGL